MAKVKEGFIYVHIFGWLVEINLGNQMKNE